MKPDHIPPEASYLPVYQFSRGGMVESVHFGAIAVVDSSGKLNAWYGNPQTRTFLRSSAKPFQALPLVELGGVEKFSLSADELAITCASHSATDLHLKTIVGLQRKIGITESDLLCCTHQPFDPAARAKLHDQGLTPTPNHHNCSGKHTGMLGQAKLLGADLSGYTEINHPVQRSILSTVSEICGMDPGEIVLGRDGCSVPTFGMPLFHAAWGWARLMDPRSLKDNHQDACRQITSVMGAYPHLIAGPGRFDTRVMETAAGKLISKAGAEAFQAVGIYPDVLFPGSPSLGIALKIGDGDQSQRARTAVTLEILRQLGLLNEDELASLADLGPRVEIRNQCRSLTGDGSPCFELQYSR
jgi:L-asparaginase II